MAYPDYGAFYQISLKAWREGSFSQLIKMDMRRFLRKFQD